MTHPADDLIAAWLADDLDADGVRALEDHLRRDQTARARFARFCQSETVLSQALTVAQVRPGTTGLRRAVRGGSRRMRVRRPVGRFGWVFPLAAAAALVAVVVTVGVMRSAPQPPTPDMLTGPLELIATGEGGGDVVFSAGRPLRVGMQVPRGSPVEIRSAGAQFRWRDGTRLTAGTGTTFQVVDGAAAVVLTAGRVDAQVTTRSDTPFRIDTPHAGTAVMGTHFTVGVDAGRTTVAVTEGRVRFTATYDGSAREVLAGENATADEQGLTRDGQVLGFVLTGREVTRVHGKRLVGRATLRLADLPPDGINLRIDSTPGVRSVRTGMRGVGNQRLEQVRDFFVFGDSQNRATTSWKPHTGTFTVDAQPFADVDGKQPLGPAATFELTIVP